ncbi:MAG: 3'-5' exonuclease [Victivallaceae bacterium]|nr:3'-5' exonuclease [Victivallaceae bacterium]
MLELERPIVFFDIESTGTNPKLDRIVELSAVKLLPSGEREIRSCRFNPEMPIPPSASAIHKIFDADVADAPKFSELAQSLSEYISGCDLAGYNVIKFDVVMLAAEFARCNVPFNESDYHIVDVFNIFCKLFPRNLTAAYKFFCGKDLEGAHGAEADTLATLEVLYGELEKFPELPRDVPGLAKYSDQSDPDAIDRYRRFKFLDGEAVVNFGKNSGRKLREIAIHDPGFLQWIIRADFEDDVKNIARNALMGIFPERPALPTE